MTKRKNKFKGQYYQKRRPRLRPPYFINKNFQFDFVRKQMKMKTDGPTINEMSPVDSTINIGTEETPRPPILRPVSTSNQIKNWCEEWWKQVLIGLFIAGIGAVVGTSVVEHGNHLTRHDKDIEYLQKNDDKQDDDIKQMKEKSNEMNTDLRLLEQRIELDNSSQTKKKK